MSDLLLFLLLFAGVAIGWWVGFRQGRRRESVDPPPLPRPDLFLDIQADEAIETFIQSLDIDPKTLEIHLALGNVLRRRGEVDRAIRLHQNLLGHADLSAEQVGAAELELARDYVAIGWLDRAENLLSGLVHQPGLQIAALQHLLTIYELSRDWPRAIDAAGRLLALRAFRDNPARSQVVAAKAHYHCELAEAALAAGDANRARGELKQALRLDRHGHRALCLRARLALSQGQPGKAMKRVQQVAQLSPQWLPEMLPLARRVYDETEGRAAYLRFLLDVYERAPSNTLLQEAVTVQEALAGETPATDLALRYVRQRPTLPGVALLAARYRRTAEAPARENLGLLESLVRAVLDNRPVYQCVHCGFSGKEPHWQCPGCKFWGSVVRYRGLDGD